MKGSIYTKENSEYLEKTKTWHAEDSPWKADQILELLRRNKLSPKNIVEVGCGVGEILNQMNRKINDASISLEGFDIATDAIKVAQTKSTSNLKFYKEDFLKSDRSRYDLLLMIDVFEHVEDYIGFIRKCGDKSEYKIYHIPLDITVSSVLRNKMIAVAPDFTVKLIGGFSLIVLTK